MPLMQQLLTYELLEPRDLLQPNMEAGPYEKILSNRSGRKLTILILIVHLSPSHAVEWWKWRLRGRPYDASLDKETGLLVQCVWLSLVEWSRPRVWFSAEPASLNVVQASSFDVSVQAIILNEQANRERE